MLRLLWVALLLWAAPAYALPWYVPDEDEASALRQTLAELWPDAPIEIWVGRPDADEECFTIEGDQLVLVLHGRRTLRPTGGRRTTAVALARSWMRELESTGGWVPSPSNRLPPRPEPEPANPPERPGLPIRWHGGLGLADSLIQEGVVNGLRVVVGGDLQPWGVDVSAVVNTDGPTAFTSLDTLLLSLAPEATRQLFADTASLALTGHRTFGLADVRPLGAGVRIAAGGGLRRYVVRELSRDDQGQARIVLAPGAARLELGPEAAVGLDLRVGDLLVRLTETDRLRIQSAGGGQRTVLRQEFVLSLDAVYAP